MTDLSRDGRELERANLGDDGVREALRSGVGIAAAGLLFFLIASLWIGTCTGTTMDPMACGVPQRSLLTYGAPLILLAGAVWSFTRGVRLRDQTARWAWFGSGWSLVALTLLSAVLSLPSLPGR